ncbi:hypothetical protein HMPREF1869_01188 [Bacteroidales bacterium KA00251]|nr:hypothetical protein HMPREF1869_01188 [Bacteroidales bacterium KA00251]
MNILTYPSAEETAKKLAERIKKEIDGSQAYYIALSGTKKAALLYRALSEEDIDWKKVHFFFSMDLFSGKQKGLHQRLAKAHLFDKAPIDPDHIHPINLEAKDAETAKHEYIDEVSRFVPSLGGHFRFDMVLVEMYDDGQALGFHPGDEELYSHEAAYLTKRRPMDNEELVTLGCEALGSAKSIVFYALGEELRFMVGNIVNLMPPAKLYPANYLLSLYPWSYLYSDSEAMREKSYAIY